MKTDHEQQLIETILGFKYDPLGFVMYAFPWGVENTPLAKIKQPRKWQIRELLNIKKQLENNRFRISIGLNPEPIYIGISSGRGIGKSAYLSMIECWVMSCWLGSTSIITANTETQLRTRTMSEIGKWHTMLINSHWFDKQSMSLRPAKWFAELVRKQLKIDVQYYYADAQTWSDENPDAFAGAHSQIGMVVIFDEASGISDSIWKVTEGFFTDLAELRIWIAISNPRNATGQFYDIFHKFSDHWTNVTVNALEVEGTDRAVYERIIELYGNDSDEARVEVYGMFPRTGDTQYIPLDSIEDSQARDLPLPNDEPLIMGVDVARYGDDESMVVFRRGRDARSIPPVSKKGLSTTQFAEVVAELIRTHEPDGVFIDGNGVGAGVVDTLIERGYDVYDVQSSSRANKPERYPNKRCEMWGEMKEWLRDKACIDGMDYVLQTELTSIRYTINRKGQVQLESKKEMKSRGVGSPDRADALALTFAETVVKKSRSKLNSRKLKQGSWKTA